MGAILGTQIVGGSILGILIGILLYELYHRQILPGLGGA